MVLLDPRIPPERRTVPFAVCWIFQVGMASTFNPLAVALPSNVAFRTLFSEPGPLSVMLSPLVSVAWFPKTPASGALTVICPCLMIVS